jgi:hypothetical protein
MTYADLQRHRIKRGLCAYCGNEPLASKRAGIKCLAKRAQQARERYGHKPHSETGMGKPPIES